MKAIKQLTITLTLSLFSLIIFPQSTPSNIADSLQAILNRALPNNYPQSGVIMSVYAPGQWQWSGAVGKGISGNTGGQPQTFAETTDRFRVGSITKMMVATCILKLEQEGRLSIYDPINNYLRSSLVNDTIQASDTARIINLLNHTSGIYNSADNTACQMDVLNNPLGSHTLEEAIYCGASQGEYFPPDFAWAYSNTNYSILAMIIENITQESYQQYITETIFTPLNLSNTYIPTTNQIQQKHMGCYWNIGNWIDLTIINPTTYTGWADVVSTTEDLNRFYYELEQGSIINATELAVMKTITPSSYDYGMGLDFYVLDSTSYVGHYGEVANTSALFYCHLQNNNVPNGYYISYNFNIQGADMINKLDIPVYDLLKSNLTGIKEIKTPSTKLFPNPAKEFVKISFHNLQEVKTIEIKDLQGKLITSDIINAGLDEFKVITNEYSKGFYFVTIKSGEIIETHKLIIE